MRILYLLLCGLLVAIPSASADPTLTEACYDLGRTILDQFRPQLENLPDVPAEGLPCVEDMEITYWCDAEAAKSKQQALDEVRAIEQRLFGA